MYRERRRVKGSERKRRGKGEREKEGGFCVRRRRLRLVFVALRGKTMI